MSVNQNFSKMIQDIITSAKDNPKIALFVPTALGGSFQLFELLSLGFPYIRFFSVSQIVSDGMLCCMLLMLLVLLSYVFSSYIEKIENQKAKNETLGWRKSVRDILITIGAMSILVPIVVISLFVFSNFDWKSILFFGLALLLSIVIGAPILYFLDKLLRKISFKRLTPVISKQATYNVILPLFGLLFLVVLFLGTRPIFRLSDNLKNTKFIYSTIDKDYPKNKKRTIVYNNDKYIFVEVIDSESRKQIESFELKDLFKRP